jgi:hypothetical protein
MLPWRLAKQYEKSETGFILARKTNYRKTMKKTLPLFITLFAIQSLFAQRFNWATSGGYAGIANSFLGAIDIARDPQGNVYTMDYGNGKQQCQGDTFDPLSSYTTFVYKFNPQGELLHVSRIGALSGDFYGYNLETDEAGSVYVLGQPNGVTSIIINSDTVAAVGNTNQLVKLDRDGTYQWKKNTGFAGNGEGCMLQHSKGYIYYQSGNLTITKMDTAGNAVSALTASYYSSPTSSTGVIYKGSSVFSNSDLLFAAYSRGVVAFGNDTLYNTGNPFLTAPILLLRCDTSLNLDWARYLSNTRDPDQNFIPVAIDKDNSVYTAVQVNDEMIIGTDTVTNPNNNFIGEGAIVKVDSAGNDVWARALQSTSTSLAWCLQPSTDNAGVIFGGGYTGNATFGTFTLSNGSNSLPFIAKLDANGNFTKAFNYLQAPSGSDANCLLPDGDGNYLVGGKLPNNTVPVFSCTPIAGAKGFYLGSFSEQPDSVPTPAITANGNVLSASPDFEGDIQWFFNGTLLNGENGPTLTATQSGNYTVEYSYTTGCVGSASSAVQAVTISSVGQATGKDGWMLYPNPSSGVFVLHGPDDNSPATGLVIKNMAGAVIYSTAHYSPQQSIDITRAAAGLYVVEVTSNSTAATFKVLKQ